MLSLHFTGSPWFLLLLPPGLFILWRQYRAGNIQTGPASGGLLLFALQALALILLTLSMTAPELRRHIITFHNPAVLIVRDQSGSFLAGRYLDVGERYSRFEKTIRENYRQLNFDVRTIDFGEVAGFANAQGNAAGSGLGRDAQMDRGRGMDSGSLTLTSLAAAADFVDSSGVPNLQGVFLFSDGRSNLDSGKAARAWKAPVFPVVIVPDSLEEVQAEYVGIIPDPNGKRAEVSVAYQSVGAQAREPSLRLLQDGKIIFQRTLPNTVGFSRFHFTWSPEMHLQRGRPPIRAVLVPDSMKANFDTMNDTVPVAFPGGKIGRTVFILRPILSLDEKGMLDLLGGSESDRVVFFEKHEIPKLSVTPDDQIWLEAEAVESSSRLLGDLAKSPAAIVLYARPGTEGALHKLGDLSGAWNTFSPNAEIKPAISVGETFPAEVLRLLALSESGLSAPVTTGSARPLVEMMEAGKRGILVGRISLAPGKRGLFFRLPRIWKELFDPQADYARRLNISAYITAVKSLADKREGGIGVFRPARAYHQVPFSLGFQLPESEVRPGKEPTLPAPEFSLGISGVGVSRNLIGETQADSQELYWKHLALDQGRYGLTLRRANAVLWRDSVLVESKAALELARIGFNQNVLSELAVHSSGRVLSVPASPASDSDNSVVTSMLPKFPAAQIRMEKTQAYHLYNNLPCFLAIMGLLSFSWLLRKKWDLD